MENSTSAAEPHAVAPVAGTPRSIEGEALAARINAAGLDWIVPAWPAPGGVGALSTTRNGGVSRGDAATMNLGLAGALRDGIDTPEAVLVNRQRLDAFLPSSPIWLRQVHGIEVARLDGPGVAAARATPPEADAAVTCLPGIVCAVMTADCLPVIFADRHGHAVGAAHAGWRGLAAGVLGATIAALEDLGARRDDIVAWMGPAIGPGAFEVGDEVRAAFAAIDAGSNACFTARGNGKWLADLYELARRQLARAGIGEVHGGGHCTLTESARFHSYRRDRRSGRMATLVWLHGEESDGKRATI